MGSTGLRSWGLIWGQGSYRQLLSRVGHGQACLSGKTFLAAAGVRVQGMCGVRAAG